MKNALILILILLGQCSLAAQAANTQLRLLLSHDQAASGASIYAALEMKMKEGWHTYWKNPGESGSSPVIEWELPAGIVAGEIQWPLPEKYTVAGFTTYVYHDENLLLIPLSLSDGIEPGAYDIKANVFWQECEQVCIQQENSVSAVLRVGEETVVSDHQEKIQSYREKVPKSGDLEVSARWLPGGDEETRNFVLEWKNPEEASSFDFFPYANENFDVLGTTEKAEGETPALAIRKEIFKYEGDWPRQLNGVLVAQTGDNIRTGYETQIPFESGASDSAAADQAGESGAGTGGATDRSLWQMMVFAFIGGLILNIMPCVLPVISLKVLGLVHQTKEQPKRSRYLGMVYGLGVLVSFWILALIAIAAQKAGGAAGWGMAFQNPVFRVVITIVITLVALNLFGVFEINLGGKAMGAADQLTSKHGAPGAFFNGVLATVLATPCTAPFLSAALAFAFTQPASIIFLMFSMVGLGLAFPFVLLCWQPRWMKFLPKPGAWMERFKVAMGFPMLATAIWLYSVSATRMGRSGPLWFGLFLLTVGLAVWIWGEFVQRGRRRRSLAGAVSVLVLIAAYFYILEGKLYWRAPIQQNAQAGVIKYHPDGIEWHVWSPEAVREAREEGRPVLVDFTAETCLNCKVNKATSLEIDSTRAKLKELNYRAFLADYTDQDSRIKVMLDKYNRPGVPLVLVYPADPSKEPIVLPEVLTPNIVRNALEKAAKTGEGSVSQVAPPVHAK